MGSIHIILGKITQKLVLGWEGKVGETKTFQWKRDKKYIETNVKQPRHG